LDIFGWTWTKQGLENLSRIARLMERERETKP
jgi:hypothetical protein